MNIFILALTLYIPIVFTLQWVVGFQSKHNKILLCNFLEFPWVLWCLSLSMFSLFGTYYTGKYILYDQGKNVDETDVSFWFTAFLTSKLPELFDTIFIVLRSKKLVPLQWYHHWATLALCYYVMSYRCNQFVYFFFMNYFVHTFMYLYFALYCYYGKHLRIFSIFVNIIQTMQMLVAIILGFYLYDNVDYSQCVEKPIYADNIFYTGMIMYATYFVLFVQLFFDRKNRLKNKNE